MEISPVEAELSHADGRTERQAETGRKRQTRMTELIVSFSTFTNARTNTIIKCTVHLRNGICQEKSYPTYVCNHSSQTELINE
jgi:hypothetical protein